MLRAAGYDGGYEVWESAGESPKLFKYTRPANYRYGPIRLGTALAPLALSGSYKQ